MDISVNIAVIYYSSTGTIHQIATELAETAEKAGADVRLRRAAELAPRAAIESRPQWADHLAATVDVPVATPDDMVWADGVLLGTPTRFGNISAQLKQYIDTLGGVWYAGQLTDKAYGAFTSGGSAHGGMETTLSTMHNLVCHFGGVIVPPAVDDPELTLGGNPYGTSHVLVPGADAVDDLTLRRARRQAERLVHVARALKSARVA